MRGQQIMSSTKAQQLVQKLASKEYRDAIVAAENANAIAFQIRAMQAERGWTQEKLGALAGMQQGFISRVVNSSGNYSLSTLRKIASAFDVALIVRFAPFSELVDWMVNLTPRRLAPPSFNNEAHESAIDDSNQTEVAKSVSGIRAAIASTEITAIEANLGAISRPPLEAHENIQLARAGLAAGTEVKYAKAA
jgi:transcriptional regulator with XRE-family HTH domain